MSFEIERKFLVNPNDTRWMMMVKSVNIIEQAYIAREDGRSVRVRIVNGLRATLGIKGPLTDRGVREFEVPVGVDDAYRIVYRLQLPVIKKIRYYVPIGIHTFEIDVFASNNGLAIAEIELTSFDEQVNLPEWLGEEVTGKPEYYNANMV